MEFVLIEPNSEEWNYMWVSMSKHPVNKGVEDPYSATNNEYSWEYIGSYMNSDSEIIHSFKHQLHPNVDAPYNISIIGTKNLKPENIRIKQKI